jgi:hypothetical protein
MVRQVYTGIQTNKSELTEEQAAGYDYDEEDGSSFVGDWVLHEDEEVAHYFGTTAGHYLSQYARSDRSIDSVYGIRREATGTT